MKKTKLKIFTTALGFFALSATFAQVDSSKSTMNNGDSLNTSVPQASPMAVDSTSVNQNSNQSSNTWSTDSTSGNYKADKKRMKAEKKEAKAEKKEGQ